MYTLLKSIFFVGVFWLISSSHAIAHGDLASTKPAINGTVAVSPTELELKFSENLNVKFSGVKIIGPANATVETGAVSFAEGNKSVLIVPILTALVAGTYTVHWHILSKDGHKTHGNYTFTVTP